MTVVSELIQNCVDENARVAIRQEDYIQRYDGLVARFEKVDGLIQDKKMRRQKVEAFLGTLKKQDELITKFDERLWYSLVDCVIVHDENDVRFKFRDRTIVQV